MLMPKKKARPHDDTPDPEQWVDRYGDLMYRFVLSRVSDSETAQDIVQEALVAAIQAYKRFQGKSSLKTWLIAILKRKVVDHYRRTDGRVSYVDVDIAADHIGHQFDEGGHWRVQPNPWTVNPEAVYQQKEFLDVLYGCLADMPHRLAEIFMLREFEGLDTQAICERLKITDTNSWVMLYRARMYLRDCLEANWLSDSP
jgi:RNA polymerase sigma-70 factor (TIGR02943 family)